LLLPGDVICLNGPLGAAKTLLTKGIAAGMGVADTRAVTSPTFTLINEHRGRLPLYHVDAYRLHDPRDLIDLGIEEYFFGDGVTIVEWAERVAAILPDSRLDFTLAHLAPHKRRLTWVGHGERHSELAKAVSVIPPGV
jgi:tRNA threonylcarbamoyladenosine biosynthesis protein TsaE